MSLIIKNIQLLKTYNEIWKKTEKLMKKLLMMMMMMIMMMINT